MEQSGWTRDPKTEDEIEDEIEDDNWSPMLWIWVAPQPTDAECGYHAILNAWSFALGLNPNPDNHMPWNRQLRNDLLDVIHLSRTGHAD